MEGKLEGRKREEKNWGKRSEERKKGFGESGGEGERLLFNTSHRFFKTTYTITTVLFCYYYVVFLF